jgi:hypothetical protein
MGLRQVKASGTPTVEFNAFTVERSGLSGTKIVYGGEPIGVSCVPMKDSDRLTCVVLTADK